MVSTSKKHPNPQSSFISPVSPLSFSHLLSSLNESKSTGPNSFPIPILNWELDSLSNILLIFPSKIKEAKIIPIFKKGFSSKVENYIPISLLSNLDRVFQRLMYNRLLLIVKLFSSSIGFWSKHSTTNSLINCIENFFKALDSGNFGCSVFMTYKKLLIPLILFSKLSHYGVCSVALSWFKSSYLFINNLYLYLDLSQIPNLSYTKYLKDLFSVFFSFYFISKIFMKRFLT